MPSPAEQNARPQTADGLDTSACCLAKKDNCTWTNASAYDLYKAPGSLYQQFGKTCFNRKEQTGQMF